MKKNILTNEKGFSTVDVLISLTIITIFSSIIITFGYNIYLINATVTRANIANEYAIRIMEKIDKLYYEEVTTDNIIDELFVEDPYKIEIDVKNYEELMNNGEKYLDLVKKVTINVKYNVGNKEKSLIVNRLKKREILNVPNKPDIEKLKDEVLGHIYPIKYENNEWKIAEENDTTWYSYSNGSWATLFVTTNELEIGDAIDVTDEDENIYFWIPKYAYDDDNNIEFLYYDSDNYIDKDGDYSTLKDIGEKEEYSIIFDETGQWIKKSEISNQEEKSAYNILNESKYKKKN